MNRSLTAIAFLVILLITALPLSAKTSENIQTPDPADNKETSAELETLELYPYFYSILPVCASACDPNADSRVLLLDAKRVDNLLTLNGLKSPIEPDQIKVNTRRHGDREIIVWSLPEHSQPTIPLYVAFVSDNGHYRYFTFEYAMNTNFEYGIDYMLGTHDGNMHSSYGLYPRTDNWQEFADIVIKKFYSNPDEKDK